MSRPMTMTRWILTGCLALTGLALGQTDEELKDIEAKLPFKMGEALEYHIHWGIFYVGKVNVTSEWIDWEGGKRIALRVRTRSNSIIAAIYPVNDYLESIIEPTTFTPDRFIKNLSEGRHKTEETTLFDRENLRATWVDKKKKRKKEYDIAEDTRDILCFMYFIRSQEFKVGETNDYQVMADEKVYDLSLATKEVERVKLSEYGKVECVKVRPEAAFNGLFVRKGEMDVWVSTDPRQVATKIVADTPFANLVIKLHEVKGPGDDFWVDKKKKPPKTNLKE